MFTFSLIPKRRREITLRLTTQTFYVFDTKPRYVSERVRDDRVPSRGGRGLARVHLITNSRLLLDYAAVEREENIIYRNRELRRDPVTYNSIRAYGARGNVSLEINGKPRACIDRTSESILLRAAKRSVAFGV